MEQITLKEAKNIILAKIKSSTVQNTKTKPLKFVLRDIFERDVIEYKGNNLRLTVQPEFYSDLKRILNTESVDKSNFPQIANIIFNLIKEKRQCE